MSPDRIGIPCSFLGHRWRFVDKGSFNDFFDLIMHDYADVPGLTQTDANEAPLPTGQESFYHCTAEIFQVVFLFLVLILIVAGTTGG